MRTYLKIIFWFHRATFPKRRSGFTLIELSIVLVIIGLIVGGVLVGRDLIEAAGVRATLTQLEKFAQASNTFRVKYGQLPGDISDPDATNFGFLTRGIVQGQGDGNGQIQGTFQSTPVGFCGNCDESGETIMFWGDLSRAKLIEGNYTIAQPTGPNYDVVSTGLPGYFPAAKLGRGNYFYIWSGGINGQSMGDGINYYGLSAMTSLTLSPFGTIVSNPGLTVREAYNIDRKIDDGQPQTGNVTAQYLTNVNPGFFYAAGGGSYGATGTAATSGSAATCFDNGNVAGAIQQYSLTQNNGSGVNCALSFKFR